MFFDVGHQVNVIANHGLIRVGDMIEAPLMKRLELELLLSFARVTGPELALTDFV